MLSQTPDLLLSSQFLQNRKAFSKRLGRSRCRIRAQVRVLKLSSKHIHKAQRERVSQVQVLSQERHFCDRESLGGNRAIERHRTTLSNHERLPHFVTC